MIFNVKNKFLLGKFHTNFSLILKKYLVYTLNLVFNV